MIYADEIFLMYCSLSQNVWQCLGLLQQNIQVSRSDLIH